MLHQPTPAPWPTPAPSSSPVVLVVDDDPSVRLLLQTLLGVEGYDVVLAQDGAAALALVETLQPDVVVLDLQMPGLSGHEVLASVREHHGELPVVVLTAAAGDADAWRAWSGGADVLLAKPFAPERLLGCLQALLRPSAPLAPC